MIQKSVLLLRGINVGGTGRLPMADLKKIMASQGAMNVATYIQSGNAVFEGKLDPEDMAGAIMASHGFRPKALILSERDIRRAAERNPFAEFEPKEMHFYFCQSEPEECPEDLNALGNGVERWHVDGKVVYLFSPGGMSKSKFADKIERKLGVAMTARSWNTVSKLISMLDT